mmetsp:Transcript_54301/g.84470  ORF Transcript_54301/g.84470 Transcript_54301/m.84470 type:complete len:371 (-) Transcript_54301:7-1119(-)
MAVEACAAAKAGGNSAYTAGDLDEAAKCYSEALDRWKEAIAAMPKPKTFSVGDRVMYDGKGFGSVESAFTIMDEYFLKDLGTDQAIWVGEIGRDLKRFSKSDLQPMTQELFDLRLACAQNLAAVRLKQEDYDEAIEWAVEALKMDGKSPKALLRKGAALLKSGRPGPASDVLNLLLTIAPKDAEAKKLLREAEKTRDPGWVCANGCCGPWGVQNHMLAQQTFTSTNAKGSTLGAMKLGPTTAGATFDDDDDDDDSDSDCSSCLNNDKQVCSKNEEGSLDSTQEPSPREAQADTTSKILESSGPLLGNSKDAEINFPEESPELRMRGHKTVQQTADTQAGTVPRVEATSVQQPHHETASFLQCCKRRNSKH